MTVSNGDYVVSPDDKICVKLVPAATTGDYIIPCRCSDGKVVAMAGTSISATGEHGIGGRLTDGKKTALRGVSTGPATFYVGADYVYRIDSNLNIINSSSGLTSPSIGAIRKSHTGVHLFAGQRYGSSHHIWRLSLDLTTKITEVTDGYLDQAATGIVGLLTRGTTYPLVDVLQDSSSSPSVGLHTRYAYDPYDLTYGGGTFVNPIWRMVDNATATWVVTSEPFDQAPHTAGVVWKKNGFGWYSYSGLSNCWGLCKSTVLSRYFVGHSAGVLSLDSTLTLVDSVSSGQVRDLTMSIDGNYIFAAINSDSGVIVRKYDTDLNLVAEGDGDASYATAVLASTTGYVLVTAVSGSGSDIYLYDTDLNLIRSTRRFSGNAYCCIDY